MNCSEKLTSFPFTDVNMEVAAVNEDDSEPAKGHGAVLEEKLDQLSLSQGQFTIVIDGYELVCEETMLMEGCKYFEAFTHFEKSRRIHIKGGVNFKIFKAIVDFLSTKSLEIDLDNCQVINIYKISRNETRQGFSGRSACIPLSTVRSS